MPSGQRTTKQYIKILFKYKKRIFGPLSKYAISPLKITIEVLKTKEKEQLHNFRMRIENSAYFHDFDWAVVVGWPLCLVIWCEKCCFCFFLFADVPKTRNILHQGARLLQLSCTKPKAAFGGKAFSLFPLLSAVCWCFKGVFNNIHSKIRIDGIDYTNTDTKIVFVCRKVFFVWRYHDQKLNYVR